ncbi:glyoxalase family protein [Pontibacter ummariensis]|uniref:Glyoxalase family protein n=1 Tax=Pontibacter ummariensis TaxID=1610492 RepID=A0A239GM08_9BACT|nr:ring-cleaving dioxygenase [Pontibacter ummariensis]PRY11339.1 glyoxalase family protein [Pontibacter ummariensis]SNS70219.1 glyoxalase family protein [Pontibacter ummariensis]
MEDSILGLHHITAIADKAKRNLDFYTKVLGLRLLKKTVNFDDPGTYHFYYGDEKGSPGTILTFFPYEGARRGRAGAGMATHIGYAVPEGSFDFWIKRFEEHKVSFGQPAEKFGEQYLPFQDPDGLLLELVVPKNGDARKPWETNEVAANVATRGFHSVTLTLRQAKPTAAILTEFFDYRLLEQKESHYRYVTDAVEHAAIIDLVEDPNASRGDGGAGTNHHIAFRVKDDQVLMAYREKIARRGLQITEKIDRNYFYSLYFREPGGVLFEIATDNPGFGIDEPFDQLGQKLLLPPQYESHRGQIEAVLPKLD